MTLKQAINKIVKNWECLKDKEDSYHTPKLIAVWVGKSDIAGGYEVDEEWIGVTPQGKIAWAYASCCSCWDGNFDTERFASLKEVTLKHTDNTPKQWADAIIKFAKTKEFQDLNKK